MQVGPAGKAGFFMALYFVRPGNKEQMVQVAKM